MNPFNFLSFDRLDLIVKYLYIFSTQKNHNKKFSKKLYEKHIKLRTLGKEDDKKNIKDFTNNFDDLILSIKKNGFDKNKFIEVNKKNEILTGAHRISTSIYFKKDIFYKRTNLKAVSWNLDWFEKKNFSKDELNFILDKYIELTKDKTFFVIIWPKSFSYLDKIKNILEKNSKIIYEKTLDFNRCEFENLIYQMYYYEFEEKTYTNLCKKIQLLKKEKPQIKLLLIEHQNIDYKKRNGKLVCKNILKIKEEIRSKLDSKIPKNNFTTLHISDCPDHNLFLKNIFFTKTQDHLNFFSNNYSKEFYKKLDSFKNFLKEKKIEIKDSLIVGSTILEVLKLRKSNDIDFITLKEIRGKNKLKKGEQKSKIDLTIWEDERNHIFNPNNYFYFNGIKFLDKSLLLNKKIKNPSDKNIEDIKLLKKINIKSRKNFILKIKDKFYFYKNYLTLKLIKFLVRVLPTPIKNIIKKILRKIKKK